MKKSKSFDERCERVANLLKLISHPARLKIICCLLEGEKTVSELEEFCGASQSSVSQHLARLKAEKILSSRREGQFILYSLASQDIRSLLEKMKEIFS